MRELTDFFTQAGRLKGMPRRGWVINGISEPESIAEHTFRATLMAWILGARKKNLNIERVIKMALIHDLCEIYAGDATPYDRILDKSPRKRKEIMKTWPRFSTQEKIKFIKNKYKKEKKGLEKLISGLPGNLKNEIKNLWLDYEGGLTPEGRFFRQTDRIENLLQALEYWEVHKKPPQKPWWLWAREFFDDPLLLECMEDMKDKFGCEQKLSGKKKKKTR